MVKKLAKLSMMGVCALGLIACSPTDPGPAQATDAAPEQTVAEGIHPESGLRVIDVTVTTAKGAIVFKTEVASTSAQQAKGLMFRTELADNEGMIFPSEVPAPRSFWMKNTPLPLDLIFIGTDGRITNIEQGEPYSLDSIPSEGFSIAVFEIRGGLSEKLGIVPGDKVDFILPE